VLAERLLDPCAPQRRGAASVVVAVHYFKTHLARHHGLPRSHAHVATGTTGATCNTALWGKAELPCALGLCFAALGAQPVLLPVVVQTLLSTAAAFYLAQLLILLIGVLLDVTLSSAFGSACLQAQRFTTVMATGNGAAAVMVCALRVLTKLSIRDTQHVQTTSTPIHFALALSVSDACAPRFVALLRTPLVRFYLAHAGSSIG
jgi:hypothetical protein